MSSTKNVVSVQIPKDKLTEIQNHVNQLQTLLAEYVVALTPDQRRVLPKMSDKTMPFVDKALEYGKANSEFVPTYMNLQDFEIDVQAVSDLKSVFNPLSQLCRNVEDTVILSGSEAYQAALTYYNNVKQAAKMNVPNAKNISDDLGKRFVKPSKKDTPTV